jgi:hypothetical protein
MKGVRMGPEELPHFEKMLVYILRRTKEAAAVDLACELYPHLTGDEMRPKISQVSVSLKRLENKGLLTDHKVGRKRLFRLVN